MTELNWMQQAIELAKQAARLGEVPVGAVVVKNGVIIGRGMNRTIIDQDPTAHAEIVALRDAAKNVANHRLVDAELYVTIEPCTMCAGALVQARIARLVFAAREPKAGAIVSSNQVLENVGLNHRIDISEGPCQEQCARLISDFFARKRAEKKGS